MSHATAEKLEPMPPSEHDIRLAGAAARGLSPFLDEVDGVKFRILAEGHADEELEIPPTALRLFARILVEMAAGHALTLIPHHAELTTQEAADFLSVSRPHLVKLLDEGKINHRRIGTHRRVLLQDLLEYKQESYRQRSETLDELTALSQDYRLGY